VARSEGLTHLAASRYQTAEVYLKQAIRENNADCLAHYYLANTLVHLNKHQEAIKQYQASYKLDSYGPVSGYCRRALSLYHAEIPGEGSASGAQIASKPLAETSSDLGVGEVSGAIDKIRHEAQEQKERHHHFADTMSAAAFKSGEQQANLIQEEAKEEIDRIFNPPMILNGRMNPLMFNPELQKAKAEEVRRNADEAAQLARNRAAQKASTFKQWSENNASVLDDSAASLERQLHDRNLPGTPRLSTIGTGLYVRNYASSDEPSPYPEPHAGIARISRAVAGPENAKEANQTELKAKQDYDAGDRPGNTVRGTVLK
jgi:tetratricopeptide (TPR) repeat protein